MSSNGLPLDNVVGVGVELGPRSTEQASDVAKSSLSADSAADSADAAFKFSRQAKAVSVVATDAAERAEVALENTQNIADANTYYITPEDPNGTIAGLAGTPDGKSFRVGLGPGKGFKTYINNNGVALEISESPSAEQVTELYGKIKTVDLELTEESSYPVAGKNGEAHIYVENKKIGGSGLSDSLHKDIQQKLGGSILSSQDGELIDENVWPALVRNGKVFGHFDGRRLGRDADLLSTYTLPFGCGTWQRLM